MQIQKLQWRDYISPGMESSGSFFTSTKFILKEHYHDFYELCLITEGKIKHICKDKSQVLHKGNFLFIRPDDFHYFETVGSEYFQFINLAIIPEVVHDLFDYLGKDFKPERFLRSMYPPCVEIPKAEMPSLKARLESFILLPRCDKSINKSHLRAALLLIVTQHFSTMPWERKTSVPVWIDWVFKEMQKKENFVGGLPRMRVLACKSPEHVCREFKKYFNKTPTEFINDTRLNYAKNLLICSDEKIINVSYESGFQNLSHFCHEFKKKYRLTPSDYRRLYQKVIGFQSD